MRGKGKGAAKKGAVDPSLVETTKPLPLHNPNQTSEETLGMETPQDMKCDSCMGISHVMAAALLRAERGGGAPSAAPRPRKRLSEGRSLEVMEHVCQNSPWVEDFGVVPGYGGRNYLVGPGLPEPPLDPNKEDVSAVVTRRGGFWEHRLKRQCQERGGVDEEDVYAAHWAGDGGGGAIARVMCAGRKQACGRFPSLRDLIPKELWVRPGVL